MSGINGIVSFHENPLQHAEKFGKMTGSLSHRGGEYQDLFLCKNAGLGINGSSKDCAETAIRTLGDCTYSIAFDGEIFATYRLAEKLDCSSNLLSAETCLIAYHQMGPDFLSLIDGCFAISIYDHTHKSLFLARDPLGIKPLFYAVHSGTFYYASEIKALLFYLPAIINETGLTELFSVAPAAPPGRTLFSGIQKLPGGHYLRFDRDGLSLHRYFSLEPEEYRDGLYETAEKIRHLVERSVHNYTNSPGRPAAFLSGGLDSSIICVLASIYLQNQSKRLKTFSIEYRDNQKYFEKNSYQPDLDDPYVSLLQQQLDCEQEKITIDSQELADALYDAVDARCLPGMADIDSSLLIAARHVAKSADWVLSGECADEIFCGYPWFHRQDLLEQDVFPWSGSLALRRSVMSGELKKLPIEEYACESYQRSLEQYAQPNGYKGRPGLYETNLHWFGSCLLSRKDAMTAFNGISAKLPFASPALAQCVYSMPWDILNTGGREKGILRYAFSDLLPSEIYNRKKSPYPKTFHPEYTRIVTERLNDVLDDGSAPLNDLIDKAAVRGLLASGAEMPSPWFGQLMRGPQLFGFLLQVKYWLKKYRVSIKP